MPLDQPSGAAVQDMLPAALAAGTLVFAKSLFLPDTTCHI
jgi:hypothetical protein